MGHVIDYIVVDKKEDILYAAEDFAFYNTDREENPSGRYHGTLTIHDDIVCDTREDAVEKIDSLDRGFYDDHAVRFYDTGDVQKSPKLIKIRQQISETEQKKREYIEKNHIGHRTSEFIGCLNCKSKISRNHYYTYNGEVSTHKSCNCPICGEDLRSNTVKNRIESFNNKIKELNKKYKTTEKELAQKYKNKAKIKWLVKVEVHC